MSDADAGRFVTCGSCGHRKTAGMACVNCGYTAQPQLRGRCDCGAPLFDDDGQSCTRCTRAATPTLDGATAAARLDRSIRKALAVEGRSAARAGGDEPREHLAGKYAAEAILLRRHYQDSA